MLLFMYENLNVLEEIKSYYPAWLRDFREISAVLCASGALLEDVKKRIGQMLGNQTIYEADEETLRAIEGFLNIGYSSERDGFERRRLISSYFVGNGRFGVNEIKDIVAVFTDSPCNIGYSNGVIDVEITRGIEDSFILNDCVSILNKRKPAHLRLNVIVSSPFTLMAYAGATVTEYLREEI